MLVGLLAAELFPTGFQFPAACYAVFYKAEHTEGTGSLKLQRPAGLNSLLSISGYLKVFPPYYREENPNKDGWVNNIYKYARDAGKKEWGDCTKENIWIYIANTVYRIYPDSVFLCIVNERVKGKEHESN